MAENHSLYIITLHNNGFWGYIVYHIASALKPFCS